ncbi:hypothetical protein AYJ54_31365 [Bradyrhizobium centrolobii]|uniref:Uncharacterized protein n=2 Tax=Bradyrhizobium TaxID=374 RepID=A0A176YPI5_9BRAD|nr:hypothetical protein AYJ54_31365 [Bradyrhizobium centrolobii]OAF09220.1 hypothetical protein AXW67_26855 [Bradyrhizobium neotropicale]
MPFEYDTMIKLERFRAPADDITLPCDLQRHALFSPKPARCSKAGVFLTGAARTGKIASLDEINLHCG